jgi:hypothetical protein
LRARAGAEFDDAFQALHGYFSGRPVLWNVFALWEHKPNNLQVFRSHEGNRF